MVLNLGDLSLKGSRVQVGIRVPESIFVFLWDARRGKDALVGSLGSVMDPIDLCSMAFFVHQFLYRLEEVRVEA